MKRIILLFTLLSFMQASFAQGDSTKAPYLRFPTFPPAKLLMTDSVSYFTKDKLDKKKKDVEDKVKKIEDDKEGNDGKVVKDGKAKKDN